MTIRTATKPDIEGILALLSQVLEIHAEIRPDIFKSGTTKYTRDELQEILDDESRPVYVATDGDNTILGYAFCVLKSVDFVTTIHPGKTLFIDDFCVDASARGRGIGKELFDYAKERAKALGCKDITLAVWEGNSGAREFYRKMGMTPKETIMEIKV